MIEEAGYDWKFIKQNVRSMTLINSDNDPWGCDYKQARSVAQKLGAKLVLAKGQGHMGSDSFNQPYRENKFVKEALRI